jgi:hypothetical protein
MHHEPEHEKEDERKEVVEEKNGAIPQRQLQVDSSKSEESFHQVLAGSCFILGA